MKTGKKKGPTLLQVPAWHGTLLPETDGDIWLTTAFADYERIVARQKSARASGAEPAPEERDEMALELFAFRSRYLSADAQARAGKPLTAIKADLASDDWYRIASGKGVLVLHELRRLLGDSPFEEAMESFGRENAGKKVTTAQFDSHLKSLAGKQVEGFIDAWTKQTHLPVIRLNQTEAVATVADQTLIRGEIQRESLEPPLASVEITIETAQGEFTKAIELKGLRTEFTIASEIGRPQRVVLDKYGQTARADMRGYSIQSFERSPEKTLIIYGTGSEIFTNREAAEALQKAIRESGPNYTIPIKAEQDATDEDLSNNHILLIGRPDTNALVKRFEKNLPIAFGQRSFTVRGKTYAHPDTGVIAVAENPLHKGYTLVLVAGLSGAATLNTAPKVVGQRAAEIVLLPRGESSQLLVLPSN